MPRLFACVVILALGGCSKQYDGYAVAIVMAPSFSRSDVTTHIIDVGAGLCTVTELPNSRFFVYDTGRGRSCRDALIPVIGSNDIDLLIISHNDHDHYGGLQTILTRFDVVRFMWTGFPR